MMKKIILVNPNHLWTTTQESGYTFKSDYKIRKIVPPLGLAYLASIVRKDHDVTLIDANALNLSMKQVANIVKSKSPDIVGVTSFWTTRYPVLNFAQMIPDDVLKIVGGSDPSAEPDVYTDAYDLVVVGEGENTFSQIVNDPNTDPSKIEGLCFKHNGKIVLTPPRPLISDLDKIPWPAWDMLPIGMYKPETMSIKYKPNNLMMMTSRGCPYHCAYCASNVVFKKVRVRSISSALDEIKYLYDTFRVRSILFMDSTFTMNRSRTVELCNSLIKEGLDIVWSCETRPDTVDKELLQLMSSAGCYFINYGVQTYNESALTSIDRPLFFDKVKSAVKETQKAGMMARLDYILGLPGETKESMRDIVKKTIEIDPDFAAYYILLLLPATPLAMQKYVIPFSNEELLTIANEGYRKFYFRLGFIRKKLPQLWHPVYLKRYLDLVSAFLRGVLKI